MKTTVYPKMNEAVTAGIRVCVETQYQFRDSKPEAGVYVFAYRIRIKNGGLTPVQLLHRHWEISDCGKAVRTVDGEGVVGKQPIINPGEEFVYISGCQLSNEIGRMSGHYEMEDLYSNKRFDVRIPPFALEIPFKLN